MTGTTAEKLLRELFPGAVLRTLKGLLGKSVQPKLPLPIEKFIEQVEGVLEKAGTSGKFSGAASGTGVKTTATTELMPAMGAPGTETSGIRTKSGRILAFIYNHPGCGAEELLAAVGGNKNQLGVMISSLRKREFVDRGTERGSYNLTTKGSESAQQLISGKRIQGGTAEGGKGSIKFVPAAVVDPGISLAGFLEPAAAPRYEDASNAAGRTAATATKPQQPTPVKQRKPKKEKTTWPAPSVALKRSWVWFEPQPAPNSEPQSAFYCLNCLETAIQSLGRGEQEAVRSYVHRLLGSDAGKTGAQQKPDPGRIIKLGAFVDCFAGTVKSGSPPAEFYEALAKIDVYDSRELEEFNDELCRAKNPYDLLVAASKFACSRYAKRVNSIADVYKEDPELLRVLGGRDGFHSETVSARNHIPALVAGKFYKTIKIIPTGINWGSRYDELLRLARVSPAGAVRFVEWASSQQNCDGAGFDLELQKYINTHARV